MKTHSLAEIAIIGATLYFSDRFIAPMFAGSGIMEALKFGVQALLVLWVDGAYTKGQTIALNPS